MKESGASNSPIHHKNHMTVVVRYCRQIFQVTYSSKVVNRTECVSAIAVSVAYFEVSMVSVQRHKWRSKNPRQKNNLTDKLCSDLCSWKRKSSSHVTKPTPIYVTTDESNVIHTQTSPKQTRFLPSYQAKATPKQSYQTSPNLPELLHFI